MKKKWFYRTFVPIHELKKWFLVMKVVVMLLLVFTMNLSASVYSQNNKFDISLNNVSLKQVFKEIMHQSDYCFMYNNGDVADIKDLSISQNDAFLKEILDEVFKGTKLKYIIKNNVIIVKGKNIVEQSSPLMQIKTRVLKGTVRDKDGNYLPGVSVVIKGTQIGVATDINGNFEIKVDDKLGVVLIFSFVGMKTEEVKVSNKRVLSVMLKPRAENIEEVFVTGYQTISKERATGSFNIVSKEYIEKPAANIATRLVGRVAGVQSKLDENGDLAFEIRGKSSLFADANPLIVVDGFIIEGDFNSINPNDVESVTVLKDAAAASIWGARSANGVIVVTTKNASKLMAGTVKVDFNSFVQYSQKPDLDYLLNKVSSKESVEYTKLSYGKWRSSKGSDYPDGITSTLTPALLAMQENYLGYLSDDELEILLNKYSSQNNRGQIKDYLINNPLIQQYNLNIASASDKSSNNISVMYQDKQTYLKGNDMDKLMINYKNFTKVFNWLDFSFAGMYSKNKSTHNGSVEVLKKMSPYEMLVDETGNRLPVYNALNLNKFNRYWNVQGFPYPDLTYNPITEMENIDKTTKQTQARFQAAITFKPIDGLNIKSQFQYENVSIDSKNIYGEGTFYTRYIIDKNTYWNREDDTFVLNIPKGDILDKNRTEVRSYTFRNQIDFDKTFGEHSFNIVAGFELNERILEQNEYPRVYGYNNDKLTVGKLPNGYGSYTNPDLAIYNWWGYKTTIFDRPWSKFTYNNDKFFSSYFNLGYTYKDKYSFSASARTDASNLITDDPKFRYSPFWSIGGSWQIGKEKFMNDINWVNRLVVRATFGYNGNVDRSTSFLPLIDMKPINNNYTEEPYAVVSSYGNPTLRWEKTGTFDLGIDYSLFAGKLFGKIDIYCKNANDLIAAISIPQVNGTASQKMNVADMVNKGIELEIGTRLPIIGDKIICYGNLNISYNKNKITNLYRSKFSHSNLLPWNGSSANFVEGKDANTIWGNKYAGLDEKGQPRIVSNDGKTYYSLATWPADDVLTYALDQGTSVAPWVSSFSLSLKVHNFDISCLLTGKFGHVFRRTSYNYNSLIPNSRFTEVLNADKKSEIMPLPQNDNESRYYFWNRFWETFTYLTESADLIRMQELSVSYRVPTKYLNKYGIKNLKLYSQVNNVFSVFSNDYNEDPEYPLGTYKPATIYTFGVNIGF